MTETTFIHNEEKLLIFLGALLFWFTLWGLAALLPLRKYRLTRFQENDLRNRIVSFIHGLIGLIFSAYQEAMHEREYGGQNSDYENALLTVSLAYFFYDAVAMAYYGQDGIGMFIHHAILILGFGTSVVNNVSAAQLVSCFFISEISNPPMHLRTILRQLNLRFTQLWETCEMSYLFLYILARCGAGPKVMYDTFTYSPSWLIKFLGATLLTQSFFYAIKQKRLIVRMVQIIFLRAQQWMERKEKGIYFYWLSETPAASKLSFYSRQESKLF